MKVVITGGGTGGHIYPGVAIAKKIKEKNKDAEILFVGTQNGLEGKIVPKEGFDIQFITVEGLNKRISFKTFSAVAKVFKGYFEADSIIKKFNPDIVIGTGGYVCGPVVLSASLRSIPTIIHEQNAFPGMTNKILSRFVDKIAITFLESGKYFNKNKVVYTGNPIRSQFGQIDREKSRNKIGMDIDRPMLLVVGGSRGAKNINTAIIDILQDLNKHRIQLLFVTGDSQYKEVLDEISSKGINLEELKGIRIVPYSHNIHDALGSCDLVVSRAGATILSEITALGTPSLLIPSPFVANNHQEYNARVLEKGGAAVVMTEDQLKGDLLKDQLLNLVFNKQTLTTMSINSKKLAITDATDKIYNEILNLTTSN